MSVHLPQHRRAAINFPTMEPVSKSFSVVLIIGMTLVVLSFGGYYLFSHRSTSLRTTPISIASTSVSELNIPSLATTTTDDTTKVLPAESLKATPVIAPVVATSSATSTLVTASSTPKKTVVAAKVTRHDDWGVVRTALGFSLKYPYRDVGAMWGDDESFQVIFYIPPTIIPLDATSSESLSSYLHNLRIFGGLDITVIKATTSSVNFDSWVNSYLHQEDTRYGNIEKVLSQKQTSGQFKGMEARTLIRQIEGPDTQKSPHYARVEIFARDGTYVYRFSHLSAPADKATVLPQLLTYLVKADVLAEEILGTFTFDKSNIFSITVPPPPTEILTGVAKIQREELLATLRKGPYWDEQATYPELYDPCVSGTSANQGETNSALHSASGIYIAGDELYADVHAYDTEGRHTGPMPMIPGFGYRAPMEEQVRSVDSINLGSAGYGLSVDDLFDGKIQLVGKQLGWIELRLSGDGNRCSIASIPLTITPRTIVTIPVTKSGDIGPISYDADGDQVEDLKISLLHPLTEQKTSELGFVIGDMIQTNHWVFKTEKELRQ